MERNHRAVYNLDNGLGGALVGTETEVADLVADLRLNRHTGTVRIAQLNQHRSAQRSAQTVTL